MSTGRRKAANPIGRPTLYLPEMCEFVEKFGREGMSKVEIAAQLNVTRQTLDNWADIYPDFFASVSRAYEYSLAWWEAQGRQNLATQGFQSALYGKAMSGRFPKEPYRDRVDVTASVEVHDRKAIDPRSYPPEVREAIRQVMLAELQRLEAPEVIEGEYEERE